MEDVVDTIAVRDTNGDEVTLYEYQGFVPRMTLLGLRRNAGDKRLELDTGEAVRRVNDDTFVIVSSGEPLFRIARGALN